MLNNNFNAVIINHYVKLHTQFVKTLSTFVLQFVLIITNAIALLFVDNLASVIAILVISCISIAVTLFIMYLEIDKIKYLKQRVKEEMNMLKKYKIGDEVKFHRNLGTMIGQIIDLNDTYYVIEVDMTKHLVFEEDIIMCVNKEVENESDDLI